MVSAILVMVRRQAAAISDAVRADLDKVMVELTIGPAPQSGSGQRHTSARSPCRSSARGKRHDNISLHPFDPLSTRRIDQLGRRLRSAAEMIGGDRPD